MTKTICVGIPGCLHGGSVRELKTYCEKSDSKQLPLLTTSIIGQPPGL